MHEWFIYDVVMDVRTDKHRVIKKFIKTQLTNTDLVKYWNLVPKQITEWSIWVLQDNLVAKCGDRVACTMA